jgi:TonB family protein
MNPAEMDRQVRRIMSVCNMHGVAFGSARELPGFLRALEENKHLAMDFWAIVARMTDEEGMRAGGQVSPSHVLNARTLEGIVLGVTNCSVAEVITSSGEPSRALGKLASLLAGEDLHQVGEDDIREGAVQVGKDQLRWDANGTDAAGVSPPEAAGKVVGGEPGPEVFATEAGFAGVGRSVEESVGGVEAAGVSEMRESVPEPVPDPWVAVNSASWGRDSSGPGAGVEPGGMKQPIWARQDAVAEPSAASLFRTGESSRLVLEPETVKDLLPEPASRLQQPATQRWPVDAPPTVSEPIRPVEPIRPQRPVDRVDAVRATEAIPADRSNLLVGGVDAVRSMEPGRAYRPNRRFEEEKASRPVQKVGASDPADAVDPVHQRYPADPIVQMRTPHLFEDYGEEKRGGAGRMMSWILLLVVVGGVLTLLAKNQGWDAWQRAERSIRSVVQGAPAAAGQSTLRGSSGAATTTVQGSEPSDVTGSAQDSAGSVKEQGAGSGPSLGNISGQSGLQGSAAARPEDDGTNGVRSQDGAGVLQEGAAAGASTAAYQTPTPEPESRSAALRAADDGKSVTSLSGDVARPAPALSRGGIQNVPVEVPGAVMENYLIGSRVPPYPEAARASGVEGRVVMRATILKSGAVGHLHVTEGHTALRGAALDAVLKWRYRPYMVNGEPAEVVTTISVDFKIAQ